MKKLCLTVVIFTILLPFYCFAFQNEPDNFNGMVWGTKIKELPSMNFLKSRGDPMSSQYYKIYARTDDDIKIGNVKLNFQYLFHENRFFSAVAMISKKQIFDKVNLTLSNLYGKSEAKSDVSNYTYEWKGKKVPILIVLRWNKYRKAGYIGYTYLPIRAEMLR